MTTIQEVEDQVQAIEAKRAQVLRAVAALDMREKTLRVERTEALAGELFDNRKAGNRLRIDSDLEKVAARAAELRDLLGGADARLADLRAGMARVQFDEDASCLPVVHGAMQREKDEIKRLLPHVFAAIIRFKEFEHESDRIWERMQKNERILDLGTEVRDSMPPRPSGLRSDNELLFTREVLDQVTVEKAVRYGVTRAMLGSVVTK